MEYVYVVQTGCPYEGGGVDEVFSSYEAALNSKPNCFKTKGNIDIWYDSGHYRFFSIKKLKILNKTNYYIVDCPICKISYREEDLYDNICSECNRNSNIFIEESLNWFTRLARNMNEALD